MKRKKKNQMIIMGAEKVIKSNTRNYYYNYFYDKKHKTLSKLGIEENFLNLIKNTYHKSQQLTSYLLVRNLLSPQRSGTRQGCPFSSLLFNIILEVPINSMKKENKNHRDWEGRNKTIYLQMT